MKKLMAFILLVLFFNSANHASHITVSGSVSGTWNVDTVFVIDNLKILSGEVLTISPGTLIRFEGYYRFKVEGQLLALGMEGDTILFSINDTAGFTSLETGNGGWRGLWFDHIAPVNDSSLFEYCKFEFSKAAIDVDTTAWYGGAVCIRDCNRLRFSNCRFVNNRAYKNGGAIYARQSKIQVDHCSFESNFCGQAITLYGYGGGLCLEYSDATIRQNYFTLNNSTGVGGGLSFEYSDPLVVSNHFFDNYSAIGGGFVCLRSDGINSIVNNLVEGNSSLFFGGGIAVLETSVLFANNTIVANFSGAGGGLYFNASSFSIFKNCVVWDNFDLGGGGPQVYIWDTFSAPEFYYCVMEGGMEHFGGTGGGSGGFIGIYENCYEIDPDFTGSGDHPYSPMQNSICINNGTPDTTGLQLPETDFAGNARIMNFFVDIGAYETLVITSTDETKNETGLVSVFPNPFLSEFQLAFCIEEALPVKIYLVSQEGRVVRNLLNKNLPAGLHTYRFCEKDGDFPDLFHGMFYLQLVTGTRSKTMKLVKK